MLILNKKKDYYDGVAQTKGIDKTIVYNREILLFEKREIPDFFAKSNYSWIESNNSPINYSHYNLKFSNDKYIKYSYFIVGFCGKLYLGFKLYYEDNSHVNRKLKSDITYDINEFIGLLNPDKYFRKKTDSTIIEKYNKLKNIDLIDLFRKYNTPIFIYDDNYDVDYIRSYNNSRFIVNPLLKDYEFYKLFDSFQTFQEIEMFIGGVLGNNEKEIINLSNDDKIKKHGFDKFSFRKDKNEKK